MLIDLPSHNTDNKPARIKKIQNLAYLKKKKKKKKPKKKKTGPVAFLSLDWTFKNLINC